jgi:hypothetical protein
MLTGESNRVNVIAFFDFEIDGGPDEHTDRH